jgi:flagellar hook-length control protein FliK
MGIERGQATGASAAVTQQRPAAGKAGDPAVDGGGFMALLAGLGAAAPVGPAEAMGAEPDAPAVTQQDARDAADPSAQTPVPGDAAAAALLAAQAAAAAVTPPSAACTTGAESAVARDAANAAERVDLASSAPQAGVDGAADTPAGAAASAPADPALPAAEYASVFEQLKHRLAAKDVTTRTRAEAAATATTTAVAANAARQQAVRGERVLSAPLQQAAWVRAEATAALGQALDGAPARSTLRVEAALAGTRSDSAWTPQEFTPTVQYDATVATVEAPAALPAAEQPLTEQLRYWVSQGMRSAELTVQGDADPVQVSISMQGNEAHVSFRSEQAATREMLTGTVDQLRDLLQAQGMVLSGVSVGAHDAGGRGGQPAGPEARARAATPRAAGGEAQPSESIGPASAARTAAGGLDLYV